MTHKQDKKKHLNRTPAKTRDDLSTRNRYYWIAGILAVTFLVFFPSVRNGFVTFDDPHYVMENPYIRGFTSANLETIFLKDANNLGNYHPVTMFSYLVNYSLFGPGPVSYHVISLLLHLACTLLIFQLAFLLFGRIGVERKVLLSSITALLFGIHPMHVESVAWISARKDLLYTCFYLLSLISYISFLERRSAGRYLMSLLFFVLSLLSKGMAVTLPLALVAIDYLFNRQLSEKRVILEKIPFFILSLVFGIIAIVVQQAQGATDIITFSLFERAVFASFGLTQYLIKFIIPYKLCGYYPYPDLEQPEIPGSYYFSIIPALFTIATAVYFMMVKPNRKIVFGILFFLINVMFVLQLFPVGSAVMADRYTYLSSFGIFFLMAAGAGFLVQTFTSRRVILAGGLTLYLSLFAFLSVSRFAAWKDSYSFWEDVKLKYPHFYPAINNLGEFYENDGNTAKAMEMFSASIEAEQENPNAYFRRGSIYGKSGRYREAIADLDQAIRYTPGFTQAYINRAIAKAMAADYPGALSDLDTVIARGKNESAYFNRGILKNQLKDYSGAIPDFKEAVTLNPSCATCYYSLGLANYHTQNFPAAVSSFSACISLDPASGYAYYYRALSYKEWGNADSACPDLRRALNLGIREADQAMEHYCR